MNKGSLARKAGFAAIAALTAFAGLAPFAPGASAAANYTQIRYSGTDRFDTSALIAAAIAEATPTAVLARADIFPDALTGAFAAAANGDGPLLLTRSDSVPARTMSALNAENVDNVILLGGPAAINASVESQLTSAGFNVRRLQGETRYQTAVAIAQDGAPIIGTIDGDRSALLSSGENFPDALSGAPLSFAAGLPSVLSPANLDDPDPGVRAALRAHLQDTIDGLNGLNIDQVFILGGPAAVDQEIEDELTTAGFSVTRLQGANRSGTSVEVFEFGMDKAIYTNTRFGLARGDTFPDALSYAPLGGRIRATVAPDSGVADTAAPNTGGAANGLLLAAANCTLSDEVETFLLANQASWTQGEILGGGEAICPEVAAEVEEAASFGRAAITLDDQTVQPGGTISGTITGENIASVTVSGCGLTSQPVTRDANGRFSFALPASQTDDCTLTFTTTFTDGSSEIDQFPINVLEPGEPNVTLSPTSGITGTSVTATLSGDRSGNITNVASTNCTVSNQAPATPTSSRTFNIAGADNVVCSVQSSVTFTDGPGGTETFTDTFTITPAGTTPPPTTGGVSAGPQLATNTPDLTAVAIVNGIPNDGITNQARFSFDSNIQTFTSPPAGSPFASGLSLQGFDSDVRLESTAAAVESGGTSVLATFPDGTDLRLFTIGTADGGVATNSSGNSVLASKALGGSSIGTASGITDAPVLTGVENPNDSTLQVTFVFDKSVINPVATQFSFYDTNSNRVFGTAAAVQAGANNKVIVTFGTAATVTHAVRHAVNDASQVNATGDADSAVESAVTAAPADDNALGHVGGGVSAPDLTSVARVPNVPDQIDFTFDRNVAAVGAVPASFAVYNVNGNRQDGTAVNATGNPATLRVTFAAGGGPAPLTQQNADQYTRAGVENGATVASATPVLPNTIGGFALPAFGAGPGFTDGPDLILATFTEASNQVRYRFDEPVAQVPAPVATSFFVTTAGGTVTFGTAGSAVVSGQDVTVNFAAGTLASAVGAGVTSTTGFQSGVFTDAAFDAPTGGNNNSPDSVGRTNA